MGQKFGTRQQKNKEETRRIIFDTAYALFEEKGYEKLTMRDLAAQAGVGLGTIFQHFKDKSTLLVSVFEHELQPLVDQAFASVPRKDLKTQLLYLVRRFYSFYAQRPNISRILIKELYIDPKNSERISNSFLADIGRLESLFEAAKRRGELDRNTNTADAVILWWSYYSFILLQALQSPCFDVQERLTVFERLMDQHFYGIANRGNESKDPDPKGSDLSSPLKGG
jgi:AcrR family transcriptional regulator